MASAFTECYRAGMIEASGAPQLVTRDEQECAVVRETVPMGELIEFFPRAFETSMAAAAAQGRRVVGPPFGIYFGMPTDVVDVAAGFPLDGPVAASGGVTPYRLPGGRVVEFLHVGTYDTMRDSYAAIYAWMGEHGLAPAPFMWESYLTEPDPARPEETRTLITWPVA